MLTTPLSVVTGQDLVHCPTKSVWWEVLFLENMMSWWHMMAPISSQVFSPSSFQTWRYKWGGGGEAANVLRALEKPIKTEIRLCRGHMFCCDHRLLWQESEETSAKGIVQERTGVSRQRQARNPSLGKSRACCYQPAACPAPGPGGHTTL